MSAIPPEDLQPASKHTPRQVIAVINGMKTMLHRKITNSGIRTPDDIIQEVTIATIEAAGFTHSMEAFIYATTMNRIGAYFKQREKQPDRPFSTELTEKEEASLLMTESEIERRIEEQHIQFQAAMAINVIDKELKPTQAKVLKMHFLKCMSASAIAEEIGTNAPYVRQIKKRALAKLQRIMGVRAL